MIKLFYLVLFFFATTSAFADSTADFQAQVSATINLSLPRTVTVRATASDGPRIGSGVMIDSKRGLILTSYHVINGANSLSVRRFDDKKDFAAKLIRFSAEYDLALLSLEESGSFKEEMPLSDGSSPKVGDMLVSIGAPGGAEFSPQLVMVSGVLPSSDDDKSPAFIRISTPLASGSSGGVLVNLAGELLGSISETNMTGLYSLAVAAPSIRRFLETSSVLSDEKELRFGFLGAELQQLSPRLREALKYSGESGAAIAGVYRGSAAEEAGIRAGDILVASQDVEFSAANGRDLQKLKDDILAFGPGPRKFKVWRDGKILDRNIKLKDHDPCSRREFSEFGGLSIAVDTKEAQCLKLALDSGVKRVEILRVKRNGVIGDALEVGDEIISIVGSKAKPAEAIANLAKDKAHPPIVVVVLREGSPRLAPLRHGDL